MLTKGNTVYITIYKDTAPPTVIINSQEYGWYNTDPGNVVDVDFSAGNVSINSPLKKAEFKFGVYGGWIEIFNSTNSKTRIYNYTPTWGIPWDKVNEGINSIFIHVFDEAGNENIMLKEIYFKRDTIGPDPPVLVSPVNNGQTVEIKPAHYWLEPNDPGANKSELAQMPLGFCRWLLLPEDPRILTVLLRFEESAERSG